MSKIPAWQYENDKKFYKTDDLYWFCNTNEDKIIGQIRGFAVELPGLGGGSCMGGSMDMGKWNNDFSARLAKDGILHLYAFPGPWSWMNDGAVRMVNALISVAKERFNLNGLPWIVLGGSMGGLGALNFVAKSALTPTACIAVCPCVDLLDRFDVVPDFPRTIVRAVADYARPIEETIKSISPINLINEMPDIPYLIVNDCDDELFPERQLDEYVSMLKKSVKSVVYDKLEGCKHGQITDKEWDKIYEFIISCLK